MQSAYVKSTDFQFHVLSPAEQEVGTSFVVDKMTTSYSSNRY